MSSTAVQTVPATRQHLSRRQALTVERLTEAAVIELVEGGYPALTVRGVAKRAGVAAATAYTYFASREHLLAEVFWRRLDGQAAPRMDRRRSPAARATDVLLGFALVVAEETELAAACTVALLADDPEVRDLRARIGGELHRRLTGVCGDDVRLGAIEVLELATTGALLQVGTGHLSYGDVPALLARLADVVLGGTR